jgi:probable F420-dependent oxidoreductase
MAMEGMPPLPEEYWRTHHQFLALTAAAAVTETLKLGTGICLVPQRDPIWLAKEVASLDFISGGRFLFGVGYGWNREEMRSHGTDPRKRREILREKVLLMRELWTKDEASFSGKHVELEKSWAWPKPIQTPHPPILMGAPASPQVFSQIVEFCDGWMPVGGMGDFRTGLPALEQACKEAGRDFSTLEIDLYHGGGNVDLEQLKPLADIGVRRVVLPLPPKPAEDVLPILDGYAKALG